MSTAVIKTLMTANNARFKAGINGADSAVKRFSRGSISKMAGVVGTAFGVYAIINFTKQAMQSAAQFDQSMRNVNTIARESETQLKKTTEEVLHMALALSKDPAELSAALYDINSAGFKASEGLDILEVATKAAKAGISDTKTAASAMVGVLNAYGLASTEAGDISDIMFQTVKEGVITFEELAEGLGKVTSTAAASGVSFDEVAAATATLTKQNIKSDQAFTSLNSLMLGFLKPTKELTRLWLEQTGALPSVTMRTEGLAKSMDILQEMTNGDAEATVKLLSNKRALKAAFALTGDGADTMSNAMGKIADETTRAGAANKAYEEVTKSTQEAFNQFSASVKVASIQIGGWLAGAFKKGQDGVESFFSFYMDARKKATATGAIVTYSESALLEIHKKRKIQLEEMEKIRKVTPELLEAGRKKLEEIKAIEQAIVDEAEKKAKAKKSALDALKEEKRILEVLKTVDERRSELTALMAKDAYEQQDTLGKIAIIDKNIAENAQAIWDAVEGTADGDLEILDLEIKRIALFKTLNTLQEDQNKTAEKLPAEIEKATKEAKKLAVVAEGVKFPEKLPFISAKQLERYKELIGTIAGVKGAVAIDVKLPFISAKQLERYVEFLSKLSGAKTFSFDFSNLTAGRMAEIETFYTKLAGINAGLDVQIPEGGIMFGNIDFPSFSGDVTRLADAATTIASMKGVFFQ